MSNITSRSASQLTFKCVIRCRNYQSSRQFYHDILELYVLEEWTEAEGRGCIFGFDETGAGGQFEIYEMSPQDPRYDAAFAEPLSGDKIDIQLKTSSLARWIAVLTDVWPFEGPDTTPWGHRWLKLRDPDHLLVAIYETG